MTRPCMNPASIIWPERDEPGDMSEAGRGRDNGRPLTAQKTRRAEMLAREAGEKSAAFERSARTHRDPSPF